MLRYLKSLEDKDVALNRSMIPLGSCTMKLNATAEMIPVTLPGFGAIHPFAPVDQAQGYRALTDRLSDWLCRITGFAAVSLQPNAGSQGEYAGLLAIRGWHLSRGDTHRDICLIPASRAWHQPGLAPPWRACRSWWSAATATATSISTDLQGEGRAARGEPRRADGHLPVHAWRVRGVDPRDLRPDPCQGRAGLHGWREHERAGRPDQPGQRSAPMSAT